MCIQYAGVKKWEDRIMRFENLTIDRSSRQVRLDGKCVEMGAYDYDILLLLAEHMGDVVTKRSAQPGASKEKKSLPEEH